MVVSVWESGLVTVWRSGRVMYLQAVYGTSDILVETIPFYEGIEQFSVACLIEVPKNDNIL